MCTLKIQRHVPTYLKMLPSSHSSATWCYMENAFMWCLPTNVHKERCVDFTIGMIKKVIHFNGESPSICNIM